LVGQVEDGPSEGLRSELAAMVGMLRSPALAVTSLVLLIWSITVNSVFATVVENTGMGAEKGGELITLTSIMYIFVGPWAGASRNRKP
jgi:hypothetical protein